MHEKLLEYFGDFWLDSSCNCRGTITTKDAALYLSITTAKAYELMKELESQGKACNIGIKVRGGYEPSDGIGAAKSKSITWQIFSK